VANTHSSQAHANNCCHHCTHVQIVVAFNDKNGGWSHGIFDYNYWSANVADQFTFLGVSKVLATALYLSISSVIRSALVRADCAKVLVTLVSLT